MMIDTHHDGLNFYARRMHFPGADGDRQLKRLRQRLGLSLSNAGWDAALSERSAAFTAPDHGIIAVRIITADGGEMTTIRKIATD
ncbi:MAG: hypothetical protein F4X98_14995 [Gammaproteobacteria bacterium]|nr:hypothetical protein [Gammaproteobacteria bacterium]